MKRILTVILMAALCLSIGSCASEEPNNINTETDNVVSLPEYDTQNPVVKMTVKGYGDIIIELYPDVAPETVRSFISLVASGYYNNNTIHRAQAGFVVQGGDPTATGTGGPGYTIKGEFALNGFDNTLKHTEGVLSMARQSGNYDSAGGQFFIVLATNAGVSQSLDGGYAAFGKVIKGMDIVHSIENNAAVIPGNTMGMLSNPLVIEKTVIDLKGKQYEEPTKIK